MTRMIMPEKSESFLQVLNCLPCQLTDIINGKDQDVYRLPPPTSSPVTTSGEPVNLRIPQIEKPTVTKVRYYIFSLNEVNDNLIIN